MKLTKEQWQFIAPVIPEAQIEIERAAAPIHGNKQTDP